MTRTSGSRAGDGYVFRRLALDTCPTRPAPSWAPVRRERTAQLAGEDPAALAEDQDTTEMAQSAPVERPQPWRRGRRPARRRRTGSRWRSRTVRWRCWRRSRAARRTHPVPDLRHEDARPAAALCEGCGATSGCSSSPSQRRPPQASGTGRERAGPGRQRRRSAHALIAVRVAAVAPPAATGAGSCSGPARRRPGAAQLHGHAQFLSEDVDAMAHASPAGGASHTGWARPTRTALLLDGSRSGRAQAQRSG